MSPSVPPPTSSPPSVARGAGIEPSERGTITGVILARDEEARIGDAIRSLLGWTQQILVLDDGSTDGTAALARSLGAEVHPVAREPGACFDALRNQAISLARGEWIYFLDADERVPPALAAVIVGLTREEGDTFEALLVPFRNYFCGDWLRHSGWWPGYCRPVLLKKGRFRYNERLHSGVHVEGRERMLPPDPELAIVHHSYDSLSHYFRKLNHYTDAEAEALVADGKGHSWQAQMAHLVQDWRGYYDVSQGHRDGMRGFILATVSGFYRYIARAKAWDLRRQRGELSGPDPVPPDLLTVLRFMVQVLEEGPGPWVDLPYPSTPTAAPAAPEDAPPIPALLWKAPLLDPSGYADEARQFVLGLAEAGEPCALAPEAWGVADAGASDAFRALIAERSVAPDTPCEVFVSHTLIPLQQRNPHARVNVARCMFETDRLPPGWEQRLNAFDAVWVPSEFNRETFVRSGVGPDKLAVVPGCVDTELFVPRAESAGPPGAGLPFAALEDRFRFLSVFDWTLHKGWDLLLEAFAREFGEESEVELWVKTWSSNHYSPDTIRAQADAHLLTRLGKGLDAFPNLHLWQQTLPAADLPRLYQAVDAFVLPTRGEGWCRPLMEAMACGLPTLATAWSGLTAFHNVRVGYPIPSRLVPVSEPGAAEIPIYRGHCWAEPDLDALRKAMRRVVAKPEEARRRGAAARKHVVKHYSRKVVTTSLQEEIARCRELAPRGAPPPSLARETPRPGPPATARFRPVLAPVIPNLAFRPGVAVDFRALLGRPLRVVWEGDQMLLSSLALVNREFCLGLLAPWDVELTLREERTPYHTLAERDDPRFHALLVRRDAALSGPPDVTVRHHFPPNWTRPEAGKLVVIQPWEYGHLPATWVAGARQADEVWAYSRWVRDVYVRSGVPAEKVRVVPLGFDPRVFTPEGPAMSLDPRAGVRLADRTRFLFVGGALDRKGADLLLAAYRAAFRADEPVCLAVKDMGTRTFYRNSTFAEDLCRAASDPTWPAIFYSDTDLPADTLASFYRAGHCLVQPYRGEGFALPPLEAMACGVMPIVTAGGPSDDYVNEDTALRIAASRRLRGDRHVGLPGELGFDCVGDPWQLEPDFDALVEALRWVHTHREEAVERGRAARAAVAEHWTWDQAARRVREAMAAVVHCSPSAPLVEATPWRPPELRAQPKVPRSRNKTAKPPPVAK